MDPKSRKEFSPSVKHRPKTFLTPSGPSHADDFAASNDDDDFQQPQPWNKRKEPDFPRDNTGLPAQKEHRAETTKKGGKADPILKTKGSRVVQKTSNTRSKKKAKKPETEPFLETSTSTHNVSPRVTDTNTILKKSRGEMQPESTFKHPLSKSLLPKAQQSSSSSSSSSSPSSSSLSSSSSSSPSSPDLDCLTELEDEMRIVDKDLSACNSSIASNKKKLRKTTWKF